MYTSPIRSASQVVECRFDKNSPSIENAKKSWDWLDDKCAKEELRAFLAIDTVTQNNKAEAHILLGTILYMGAQNIDSVKKDVLDEFIIAYRLNPEWKGTLEYKDSELQKLLNEALIKVRDEMVRLEEDTEEIDTLPPITPLFRKKKGLPPKKIYWALSLAAVLAAGTYMLFLEDGTPQNATIPEIPTPPD